MRGEWNAALTLSGTIFFAPAFRASSDAPSRGSHARHEKRGLGVLGARELLDRTLEAEGRQGKPQHLVSSLEYLARLGIPLGQRAPHAHRLRSLPGKEKRDPAHQRTTAAAHVKPPPNVTISTRLPGLSRPCFFASSSASGIEAEEVLP